MGSKHTFLRFAVTVAAVAAGIAHLAFPEVRVDAFIAMTFAVALLPWLFPLVKSFELPGGFKVELQEIRAEAARAKGAAASAGMRADVALASVPAARPGAKQEDLAELAAEYDRVRASRPASGARTRVFTVIVGRMRSAVERGAPLDIAAALVSGDAGTRLAAYAALEAKPSAKHLDALVNAIVQEDGAFGQYWAVRALAALAAEAGVTLSRDACARLGAVRDDLGRDSDRAYELDRVLEATCAQRRTRRAVVSSDEP